MNRIASLSRLCLSALLMVSMGCEGAEPGGFGPGDLPVGGDAGPGTSCPRPAEGCPCGGESPIRCYLDPEQNPDGSIMCREGTRYCRDGAWTACESIHEYTLETTGAPLVTGPTECNMCDPSCAVSRDRPDDSDLPGSSAGLDYDVGVGGVTLDPALAPPPPVLPDSDGDGIPDVADQCTGPGAFQNADGSCYGDTFFFHNLPYNGPAVIDPLDIDVQVRSADVYFLMDTTGSMGGEITNLKATLTSGSFIAGCSGGVIGAIRCTIPDAYFGVGRYDDFPYGSYGGGSDVVYEHLQDIDVSVAASQTAVNSLNASGGADFPESQSQALYATVTGNGLGSSYLAPRTGCPAGTFGYPCFRDDAIPIIINITDAAMHNGPDSSIDYSGIPTAAAWGTVVSELNARSARVITIVSGSSSSALSDANALADATGSYDSAGARYVYQVDSSGSGLDMEIVDAVVDLANFNRIDISARATDDAATPGVDERDFVQSIAANAWGPGNCSGISGGTTFIQCLPGTQVDFSIAFRNDFVMPTTVPQTFTFFIEIVGDGSFIIDRIPVRILVPPVVPAYPPTGEYWRDYDSGLHCADNERPDWGMFNWTFLAIPPGTSVVLEFRAAETMAGLMSATPVTYNVTTLTGTVDVAALLQVAGLPTGLPFLRATVVLNSNVPLLTETPVMQEFELLYNCVPVE